VNKGENELFHHLRVPAGLSARRLAKKRQQQKVALPPKSATGLHRRSVAKTKKETPRDAKTMARLRLFVATNRFETPTPRWEDLSLLEQAQSLITYQDLLREFGLLEGEVLLITDNAGLVASKQIEVEEKGHFDCVLTDSEYTEFIHRFEETVHPRYECFFVPISLENLSVNHYLRKNRVQKMPKNIQSYWVQESGLYLSEKETQWMRFLWAWDGSKLILVDWLGDVDPAQNLR
jgi:hypothetical protein